MHPEDTIHSTTIENKIVNAKNTLDTEIENQNQKRSPYTDKPLKTDQEKISSTSTSNNNNNNKGILKARGNVFDFATFYNMTKHWTSMSDLDRQLFETLYYSYDHDGTGSLDQEEIHEWMHDIHIWATTTSCILLDPEADDDRPHPDDGKPKDYRSIVYC